MKVNLFALLGAANVGFAIVALDAEQYGWVAFSLLSSLVCMALGDKVSKR